MGQGCSPEPRDQKTSPDCAWLRLQLGTDVGETCNHGWLEQGFFCMCMCGREMDWAGLSVSLGLVPGVCQVGTGRSE